MSLNLSALTGANTVNQLVYDINQIKILAANTTSPTFSTSLKVNGFAQLGSTTDGVVIENDNGTFDISNAAYIRRNSSTGDLEIYASSSTTRNLIFGSSSGSEAGRFNSNGQFLRGYSANFTYGGDYWTPGIQELGTQGIAAARATADAYGGALNLASARGSITSPTIVVANDTLGGVYFSGYDGGDFNSYGAAIEAQVDGTPGLNDMPGRLVFYTVANGSNILKERVRIDSSGQLGVGTSDPQELLHVYELSNVSADAYQAIFDNTNSGSGAAGIAFNVSSSAETFAPKAAITLERTSVQGRGTFRISVDESTDTNSIQSTDAVYEFIGTTSVHRWLSSGSERMRIDSSGQVGIGVAPTTTLDVNGALTVRNDILGPSTSFSYTISADPAASVTSGGFLQLYASAHVSAAGDYALGSGNVYKYYFDASVDGHFFSTGGSERLRIDSSGNLLVGTTTARQMLTVQGGAYFLGVLGQDIEIGGVDRWAVNAGINYILSYSSDSGSTYTEAMRIDTNGLRIGTTAEVVTGTGGELLSLQGTATKTALSIKGSDVTNINSWNTGSSAATRYHLICWNPAGNQEFHLRRETDGSIRLAALQAALQLDGNTNGIYIKDTTNFEDNTLQRPILKDYGETSTSPSSSSGTLTLDITNGNAFQVTLTENVTTLSITNPTASGNLCSITVRFVQGAGPYTVAWPASFKWAGGSAGTVSTGNGNIDVLTAITWDGGTTWYAVLNNGFA